MATKTSRTKASKPVNSSEPNTPREFLIVTASKDITIGSSMRIIGVANSEKNAQASLRDLNTSGAGRIAILERKGVFDRRPAMVVTEVDEPIVPKKN